MRCGWCTRKGIERGESHTVPSSATGQVPGRGGAMVCRGYETFVRLAEIRVSQDRSGEPREIRG
jgi:hypothetical protein